MGDAFERQARLREVGELGQRRIVSSVAQIARGPAASIELAYLVRAGVERASIGDADPDAFAHASWFRFSGPRRVARGAGGALTHLLRCLELK